MTPQPYRDGLALSTCLDLPRQPTCETRAPPRRWVIALAAVSVLGGATCAVVTAHRGGQVEIAPAALTHALQKPKAQTPPKPPAPAERAPVGVHAWLGGVAHDPAAILGHARELQRLGLDLTVIDATLNESINLPHELFEPGPNLRVIGDSHGLVSIELHRIATASPLRLAGVEEGDQVLGIDGYRLDDESLMLMDVAAIQRRGQVVLELARGDRHLVLSIRWYHVP